MGASAKADGHLAQQGQTRTASRLEFLGLAGDFGHLCLSDPFHVRKLGSTYRTEVRAGVTTFLALAYILPVNSSMLSLAIPGMREQLACATALSAMVGCCLMAVLSNYPFALAPGMGTNAFFTFSVVLGGRLAWQAALAAVFTAACLFIMLSVTGLRTLMVRLFPAGVKESIGVGIGLFLAFIAFQKSEGMGISAANAATLVSLSPLGPDSYDAAKIWLSFAVLCLTAACFAAKIPGAPLIGITFGTCACWAEGWLHGEGGSVFGYPFGTGGDHTAKGFHIYTPHAVFASPSLAGLAGAVWEGFNAAADPATRGAFWSTVLVLCYTDLLDASGTFVAVAKVAGLTDSRGNLPLARQNMAYLADALSALVGSTLGVSTVVTFAESTAGISDGGRTGLASLVTGACFALAVPFTPVVSAIPPLATGPILLVISALMFSGVKDIDWEDFEESFPAFVTAVMMPFTFNIGYGIVAGVMTWLAIQVLLAPQRLSQGISPFVRAKAMWADAWVEPSGQGDEDHAGDEQSAAKEAPPSEP